MSLKPLSNVFQHQPDATLSQTNPVSATLYTVLDTTKNVRIISIAANITWATTQPTPLEVVITIDGQSITHSVANPISATWYFDKRTAYLNEASQELDPTRYDIERSFLYEGRSVKVEARITWATTQPTPLACRVKYAKM